MRRLWERHIDLVRAVNESATQLEHDLAQKFLSGFRDCAEIILEERGIHIGRMLMAADMFYLDQGIERPMCCGVWLDWEPKEG